MTRVMVLLIATAVSGCASVRPALVKAETKVAGALVSDEEEARLGLQVHDELVNKQKVKISTNPVLVGYVEGLVAKLKPAAEKERKLEWKTYVIEDDKTVNAFATPGGHIYVFTGLLLAAQNEAQVVGVMGHEMGHVVGRHGARQLVTAYGLEAVAMMALGQKPNQIAEVAAMLAAKGSLLAYGRGMENEADEYGVRYAHAADYDPHAIASFFEMLSQKSPDLPKVLVYLSTHPTNASRIAHINTFIEKGGFTGTQLAPERLAAIKSAIRQSPSAMR
jgi:beta-barrel assembly-enhancing protease